MPLVSILRTSTNPARSFLHSFYDRLVTATHQVRTGRVRQIVNGVIRCACRRDASRGLASEAPKAKMTTSSRKSRERPATTMPRWRSLRAFASVYRRQWQGLDSRRSTPGIAVARRSVTEDFEEIRSLQSWLAVRSFEWRWNGIQIDGRRPHSAEWRSRSATRTLGRTSCP